MPPTTRGDAMRATSVAKISSIWIVNKSGGLIFQKTYDDGEDEREWARRRTGALDTNAHLRLASVWHSLHAISRKVAPVRGCTGIECLECDTFDLFCFQSSTGTKFFVTTQKGSAGSPTTHAALRRAYQAFCDYALKNPFYEVEMPVRCELFEANLGNIVRVFNERS